MARSTGKLAMFRKVMIGLTVATLWSMAVPQAASAGYYCYGDGPVGSPRCAGVGLGLHSPRWYYSDQYPYWIYYDYPGHPYSGFRDAVGCQLVCRPVLDPRWGWRTGIVQFCN